MNKKFLSILFLSFLVFLFFSKDIFLKGKIFAPVDEIYLFKPWSNYRHIIPQNFQEDDALYQFIPWRFFSYEQMKKGGFPLWNSYEYGGIPFFANDQSAALSPYNFIGLFFGFKAGFLIIAILKLLVTAAGMYLFLSLFSLEPISCIIGSIAFTFSALIVTWLYSPISSVASIIPWLFWAFEKLHRRILTKKGIFISLFSASAILAVSFFLGHSETTVNVLLGIIIYYAAKILIGSQRRISALFILAGTIILGFILASAQIIPFLQILFQSAPYHYRSIISPHAKIYLPVYSLVTWFIPNIAGSPSYGYFFSRLIGGLHEAVPYIGVAPLLLGFSTVANLRTDYKRLLPFWIMILFGFGMAYGIPVFSRLTTLPVLTAGGAFRYIILMEFGFSALSAFGLDRLMKHTAGNAIKQPASKKPLAILLMICLSAIILYMFARYNIKPIEIIVGLLGVGGLLSGLTPAISAFVFIQIVLSILFISGAVWLMTGARKRQLLGWIIPAGFIALTVTDLFIYGIGYNPDVSVKYFYPVTPIIRKLKGLDTRNYSFYAPESVMPTNTAMVYHIRDFRGYDIIVSDKYRRFLYLLSPQTHPNVEGLGLTKWSGKISPVMAGIAGIRYFIFRKTLNPEKRSGYFKLLGRYKSLLLYENTLARPIAYPAYKIIPAQDDQSALKLLSRFTAEDTDLTVVQGIGESRTFRRGSIKIKIIKDKPGMHAFEINAKSDGFLVLNESSYPGWHAYIDNKSVHIFPANYLFQGIKLPQGDYKVTFEYKPLAFYIGLVISIIVFGIMLLILIGKVIALYVERRERHYMNR